MSAKSAPHRPAGHRDVRRLVQLSLASAGFAAALLGWSLAGPQIGVAAADGVDRGSMSESSSGVSGSDSGRPERPNRPVSKADTGSDDDPVQAQERRTTSRLERKRDDERLTDRRVSRARLSRSIDESRELSEFTHVGVEVPSLDTEEVLRLASGLLIEASDRSMSLSLSQLSRQQSRIVEVQRASQAQLRDALARQDRRIEQEVQSQGWLGRVLRRVEAELGSLQVDARGGEAITVRTNIEALRQRGEFLYGEPDRNPLFDEARLRGWYDWLVQTIGGGIHPLIQRGTAPEAEEGVRRRVSDMA